MGFEARRRWKKRAAWTAAGIAVCAGLTWAAVGVVRSAREGLEYRRLAQADGESEPLDPATESRVRAFCGDCHAMPRFESFYRDAWHDMVRQGYEAYARSGRTDLDPPPIEETVAMFRARAAEKPILARPENAVQKPSAAFRMESIALGDQRPAIADLRWTRIGEQAPPVLLACDMGDGSMSAWELATRRNRVLARLQNPCHIEPCDLDADGVLDLLVADLGSMAAAEHDRGRVVWLRGRAGGGFEEMVVAAGLGRVADARCVDIDGDGDLDLVVAEFGLMRTGKILLLRNVARAGERPRFEPRLIDPRPGTTCVLVHDLDGDRRPDLLALVSQEYECVEAFLNQGEGRFHRKTLWSGPDLTFGSSLIDAVDLDHDGDLDVLYANGDAFDNLYVTPWHGIQWLENKGSLEFEYHRVTDLPGACRVRAADFDGDGDLDILAVAFLPSRVRRETLAPEPPASIVFLEQTAPGQFARHVLESGFACHAALEVDDFDGDGDVDFAVAGHRSGFGECPYALAIWWNQRVNSLSKR